MQTIKSDSVDFLLSQSSRELTGALLTSRQLKKPLSMLKSICMAVLMMGCWSTLSQADEWLFEEVAAGVFVHTGTHKELDKKTIGDISNSAFIIGADKVIVIDPGGSLSAAAALVQAVNQNTTLPIKYVVLSHFHPDHVAGAAVFGTDVEIIAHHRYPRAVLQRSQFYTERFDLAEDHWAKGRPASLVHDNLAVNLGNRSIEITAHATAHTDNDLSVFDPSTRTLLTSDLVFQGRTPSLDGSINGWLIVLDRLKNMLPELVVPGHGDSGDWETTVRPQYDYLVRLRDRVRSALRSGSTLSEAIANGKEEYAGHWLLFDSQHPVNITKAFTELEWE